MSRAVESFSVVQTKTLDAGGKHRPVAQRFHPGVGRRRLDGLGNLHRRGDGVPVLVVGLDEGCSPGGGYVLLLMEPQVTLSVAAVRSDGDALPNMLPAAPGIRGLLRRKEFEVRWSASTAKSARF